MSNTHSTILAKCYLNKINDDNNVCLLTAETLTIKHNAKPATFFVHWITDIKFHKKIFLMPIVFGGIAASLSGVGLFQYYLNPWLMLSILFISIISIYYGVNGSMAMTIATPIKEYDFFIHTISDNLKAFAAYTLNLIQGDALKFYFHLASEDFLKAKEKGFLAPGASGIQLFSHVPVVRQGELILTLNSLELPFEIKYIRDADNRLSPYVMDRIPMAYVDIHAIED